MRKLLFIIFLFSAFCAIAQQSSQYSQYSVNNFGYNPAFVGTTECLDFKVGRRYQWVGFDGAPRTSFASIHTKLGNGRGYGNKGKHGLGLYIEQDKIHLTKRSFLKGAYAYHKKLFNKLTLGLGVFVGIQQYGNDNVINSGGDPVLVAASGSSLRFPDISPGLLLYNNKFYFSFSVNQLYFKDFNVGLEAKQINQYYVSMGKKSVFGDWTVYKSFLLKQNILGPPALDLNLSWIYKNNLTFGVGYRVGEAITTQLKFRLLKNLMVSYAFDFPLNKVFGNYGHEIILGYRNCETVGAGEGSGLKPHICPAYD